MNDGASELEKERIDREASDWLGRLDRGLTPEEEGAILAWLKLDSRHGDRLDKYEQNWAKLGMLISLANESDLEGSSVSGISVGGSHWTRRLFIVGAMAAVVAFAFLLLQPSFRSDELAFLSENEVALECERHVLDDGSIVELNKGAQVEVSYTKTERRVRLLAGEAHFTVAKNKNRPFLVTAQGATVRAVGTAFSVQLKSDAVEVLVTEGRVRMERASVPKDNITVGVPIIKDELSAGSKVEIVFGSEPKATLVESVSEEDVAAALAWIQPMIDFSGTQLSEVIEAFNRRNSTQIQLEDEALGLLPITATVHLGNPGAFASILELTEEIEAHREGDSLIILRNKD